MTTLDFIQQTLAPVTTPVVTAFNDARGFTQSYVAKAHDQAQAFFTTVKNSTPDLSAYVPTASGAFAFGSGVAIGRYVLPMKPASDSLKDRLVTGVLKVGVVGTSSLAIPGDENVSKLFLGLFVGALSVLSKHSCCKGVTNKVNFYPPVAKKEQ